MPRRGAAQAPWRYVRGVCGHHRLTLTDILPFGLTMLRGCVQVQVEAGANWKGDGDDGAHAVNPMLSSGKGGSNPLGLSHATLNVLRKSVVGQAPATLKQRDSGNGSGGDDGNGGRTATPETRMARRSVADVEPSAHV